MHAVVKAVSEQGVRLNIRKATLREWRLEFARHLREQGIEANATERAVRGQTRVHKPDGIYRASCRGTSTHMRQRAEAVAAELLDGGLRNEAAKPKLLSTRKLITEGWRVVSTLLDKQDQLDLARHVRQFMEQMSPPQTEKEKVAAQLLERAQAHTVQPKVTTR